MKHIVTWHGPVYDVFFAVEADSEDDAIGLLAEALNEGDQEWLDAHEVSAAAIAMAQTAISIFADDEPAAPVFSVNGKTGEVIKKDHKCTFPALNFTCPTCGESF